MDKTQLKLAEIDREKAENVFSHMIQIISENPESAIQKQLDLMVIAGMLGFGKNPREVAAYVAERLNLKLSTILTKWQNFATTYDSEQAGFQLSRPQFRENVVWPRIQALMLARYKDGMSISELHTLIAHDLGYTGESSIRNIIYSFDKGGIWRKKNGIPYQEGSGIPKIRLDEERTV